MICDLFRGNRNALFFRMNLHILGCRKEKKGSQCENRKENDLRRVSRNNIIVRERYAFAEIRAYPDSVP